MHVDDVGQPASDTVPHRLASAGVPILNRQDGIRNTCGGRGKNDGRNHRRALRQPRRGRVTLHADCVAHEEAVVLLRQRGRSKKDNRTDSDERSFHEFPLEPIWMDVILPAGRIIRP